MSDSAPYSCRRFLVTGRVQGVFFRAGTQQVAQQLRLTGHAVNLPDGRVEVLACGADDALDKLASWLEGGTPRSRVDDVQSEPVSTPRPSGFRTG